MGALKNALDRDSEDANHAFYKGKCERTGCEICYAIGDLVHKYEVRTGLRTCAGNWTGDCSDVGLLEARRSCPPTTAQSTHPARRRLARTPIEELLWLTQQ